MSALATAQLLKLVILSLVVISLVRSIPKIEGVRNERWKYTRYTESTPPLEQLFELVADQLEEQDLAPSPAQHETVAQLRARCDEYRATLK